MTRSAARPLSRQYACALTSWRTSSMCATSAIRTQHDREIAGDAVGPQPRLAAAVARDHAARRAQRRVGVQDVARRAARRAGCRRSVASSRRSTTWLCVHDSSNTRSAAWRSRYFSISAERAVARLGDAGHDVDPRRLVGLDHDACCGSRRSDRAPSPRCRSSASRCIAAGSTTERPRPMNAARPVSYDVAPAAVPCTVIRCIIHGGRSPPERGRRVHRIACCVADELGLHEQVAERRVRRVGRRRAPARPRRSSSARSCAACAPRLVRLTRRSSMSSSGETLISTCVSMSSSRRRNSARPCEKIAS